MTVVSKAVITHSYILLATKKMPTHFIRFFCSFGRTIRNLCFDYRYGGFAGGYVRNPHPGATGVASTDYAIMPQLFENRIGAADVLVDIGSGKGRVINWWLSLGLKNRIIGLEMMEDVATKAQRRLKRFKNVEIVHGDAIANLPQNGTLFYLFNSFDDVHTIERFKERLLPILQRNPDAKLIYWACVYIDCFRSDNRWTVEETEVALPPVGFFEERHRHLAIIRAR